MDNYCLRYRSFGPPAKRLGLERDESRDTSNQFLRVEMSLAPINPSDLIPITGAYAHRIKLPAVAGYEGEGRIVDAPRTHTDLIGQRVLPLRGRGTWQCFVDCDPALAISVPNNIDDTTAARSYINPLAAIRMLEKWPVLDKRVLLTRAGSTCANLLGLWARQQGATEVIGVYRSPGRAQALRELGIKPLRLDDKSAIEHVAKDIDITFDALGGPIATSILESMKNNRVFVGYGLLTGWPLAPVIRPRACYHRFHLRDELQTLTAQQWQQHFHAIWPRLLETDLPCVRIFPLTEWREAIDYFETPGNEKPMLDFTRQNNACLI
ncbi:zinc-dependent alcohol dehydrogenase family protein [Salinisphaera sp. SPP-AMP-43]|uniref:zinc-dependent alcohol dehydrogenase family protein n=1 Tax=Salinisphaera sp. SPP-AMP-43 TaxID=3121288 RepID=UPI003C6E4FEF